MFPMTLGLALLAHVKMAAVAALLFVARLLQETPLPEAVGVLVVAFLTIAAGITTVITLTGAAKWLAEKTGREIGGNQVRIIVGAAAVATCVVYAAFCACAGIVAFPIHGSQQEMLGWLWTSSGALILLSMAVWRRFVRPEPDILQVPGTLEAIVGEPLVRSG